MEDKEVIESHVVTMFLKQKEGKRIASYETVATALKTDKKTSNIG